MTVNVLPIKNPDLFNEAFTHRSFLNENQAVSSHNERLEFLGDAVLELAVSEFLYSKFPDKQEGELTAFRASLVRTSTLASAAKMLDLGSLLKLSKGEEQSGGRTNPSLLANTLEACLGAIYLDQGMKTVVNFLYQYLFPSLDTIISKKLFKDYKSSLQELVQAKGFASPEYQVISEDGPDHSKVFTIIVLVGGKKSGEGKGKSKQAAQQDAARSALENLNQS